MKYYASELDIDRRVIDNVIKDILKNETMEYEVLDQGSKRKHGNDPSRTSGDVDITNFIQGIDTRFIMKHVQDELSGITGEDEVSENDVYDIIKVYLWDQVEEEYGFYPDN